MEAKNKGLLWKTSLVPSLLLAGSEFRAALGSSGVAVSPLVFTLDLSPPLISSTTPWSLDDSPTVTFGDIWNLMYLNSEWFNSESNSVYSLGPRIELN